MYFIFALTVIIDRLIGAITLLSIVNP